MKILVLVITLASVASFAGASDLNEEGEYGGVHSVTQRPCTVIVSGLKVTMFSGKMKSATVRSSLFLDGESIPVVCKSNSHDEYYCMGQTLRHDFVRLRPLHVESHDENEMLPDLTVHTPLGGKSILCENLIFVKKR